MNLMDAELPSIFNISRIITLFKVRYSSFYDFPNDRNPYWAMCFVESGPHRLCLQGTEYAIEAGSIFFLRPGQLNEPFRGNVNSVVCEIGFTAEAEQMQYFENRIFPPSEQTTALAQALFQKGVRFFYWNEDVCCDSGMSLYPRTRSTDLYDIKLRLQLLLNTLYANDIGEKEDSSPKKQALDRDLYAQAVSFMRRNLDKPLLLQGIADALGVSASSLKKLFADKEGCGVMKYLSMLRLERAKELLQSGKSVGETADALGFSSPSYFSRWFKNESGISPTQYNA